MKRDIVLYIAMSLDGYIAKSDGSVDWLAEAGGGEEAEAEYQKFYSRIDAIVMGRTTFEQVVTELSPDRWVYEGKNCYVFTNRAHKPNDYVEFISGDISEFLKSIKDQPGKDIWILGGANLAGQLIELDLIDRYIVTVIPVLLGNGIPLFPEMRREKWLELKGVKNVGDMVELDYARVK